jgi:YD repeat-containing protein
MIIKWNLTMTSRIFLILLFFIAPIAQAKEFTYDALGRLKTVTDDSNVTVTYEYDAVGNRETLSTTGSTTLPTLVGPKIDISWSTPIASRFGHSATLTWSAENATQCTGTIIPLNKLLSGTSGSAGITAQLSTTAELTCTNAKGSSFRTAYLIINGACPPNSICLPPGDSAF